MAAPRSGLYVLTSLLLLINAVRCRDSPLENITQGTRTEMRLIRDITENYDFTQPPAHPTTISMSFIVKSFRFDSQESIFTMHIQAFLDWTDERLKWKPTDYDGISQVNADSFFMWTPNLEYRTFQQFDDIPIYMSSCGTFSSGSVMCVPNVGMETACNANLTNWPYDVQTCTFKLGPSSKRNNRSVVLKLTSSGIKMYGADYGHSWDIIDFSKEEDRNGDVQIQMHFVVERKAAGLAAVIIVPSLLLAVFTTSSLFLEPDNTRLSIATLSLVGHFYFLKAINEHIPSHGQTPPSVLRFMTVSISFTFFTIILTLVLGSLRRKIAPPPPWMVSMNGFVFESAAKFFIWPRWRDLNSKHVENENRVSLADWVDFTNVINSCVIVVAFIIYLSTYFSYIPH